MAQGYGIDTWCFDALQPGRLVSGRLLLAQAIYRRITTPRGTLRGGEEERVYGLDLSGYVGAVGVERSAAIFPTIIRAELMKDDRISSVRVTAAVSSDATGAVYVSTTVDVEPVGELESFSLTLAISEVTTAVLGGVS